MNNSLDNVITKLSHLSDYLGPVMTLIDRVLNYVAPQATARAGCWGGNYVCAVECVGSYICPLGCIAHWQTYVLQAKVTYSSNPYCAAGTLRTCYECSSSPFLSDCRFTGEYC